MIPVTLSTKDGERKERKNPEDTGKGERNTDHLKLRGLENSVMKINFVLLYIYPLSSPTPNFRPRVSVGVVRPSALYYIIAL